MRFKKYQICILSIALAFALSISIHAFSFLTTNSSLISGREQSYFDLANEVFSLTHEEINLLENNKFVVLNRMGTDDIIDAFDFYWQKDLPIFITTDTMLHIWHLVFEVLLEKTEELILYPLLSNMTQVLTVQALNQYYSGIIHEKTLIYFTVALNFSKNPINLDIPGIIKNSSNTIINAILNEISIYDAISQLTDETTQRFIDDFSQYRSRGHYIHSEDLKNYFRLFKWFSRIPFFFDDYKGEYYLNETPQEMINSVIEVTWLMKNTNIFPFNNRLSCLEFWSIYKSFIDLVNGKSNAITIAHINEACSNILETDWNLSEVNNEVISQIQNEIQNDSSIPSPVISHIINEIVPGNVPDPKMFVLFGERFTLDSYAFDRLVHPYVYGRLLPKGLDFAATCLESSRALELLENEIQAYPGYHNATLQLQNMIKEINDDRKETVQWKWIESLKHISVTVPESEGTVYLPQFMSSSEWLDEKLTTIMGSYAQLRHDTILYAKQSNTGYICSTPMGYVEPYPKFYESLGQLTSIFRSSFSSLEALGYDFNTYPYYFINSLDVLYNATVMLKDISVRELSGIPLTEEQKLFLQETYGEGWGCAPFIYGWLPRILQNLGKYGSPDPQPDTRASLVADVHTDPNTGQILHLATGVMEHIIAIVPGWNGKEVAVVGPVFSYYEFSLTNFFRMNDYEWRGIISAWHDGEAYHDYSIFERGFWSANYMSSTSITKSIIYQDDEIFDPPPWF